ncbi:MAG: phosphatidylserine/phosphatidylglycerophosphate/cardiolipin synthase family protein, partial [Mesorhizobium sp.]
MTRLLLGLALTALAGCAGMPGRSACAFFPGDEACARPPISADRSGAEIASAGYFADNGSAAYEKRFEALLAQSRIDALDRTNGTGRFGRDWRDVHNDRFQATYPALQRLAKPLDSTEQPLAPGKPGEGHFTGRWRMSRQTLYLDAAARPSAPKSFSFSGLQARSVEIVLRQAGRQPVVIGGSCDGSLAMRVSGRSRTIA